MNAHLEHEKFDNFVEVLANSDLLVANFALFSNFSSTICCAQTYSEAPKGDEADSGADGRQTKLPRQNDFLVVDGLKLQLSWLISGL